KESRVLMRACDSPAAVSRRRAASTAAREKVRTRTSSRMETPSSARCSSRLTTTSVLPWPAAAVTSKRSSTSASATASWLSSRSGASRIRYLGGLLVPEVGELGVGERISEVVQVVSDVDDQDFFGATVLRTAEPSPDHLDVLVGRKRGSAEIDGVDLRCVESLTQDVEVREDFDLTIAEPLHQGSAPCGVGASVDRCRLDP